MKREKFEELAARAIDELPEEFRSKLENVDITVEDEPSGEVLRETGAEGGLLGLYRGVPLPFRGTGYGAVLPDAIVLYRRPIESVCRGEGQVRKKIAEVLIHEIGHHFGMNEEDMP